MIRSLRTALFLTPLLAILVACGGGSSGPPANVLDARQSMPVYPNSEGRGTGAPPPALVPVDHPKHFAGDATYFVAVPDLHDAIQQYYQTELPKLGWIAEDPPVLSHDSEFANYCQTPGFITCKSYTKDQVRAIILTIITFSFGGGGREGSAYHLHVEEQ